MILNIVFLTVLIKKSCQGYPCTEWIYSMPFGGDAGETPFLCFVKVEVKSYQT